MFTQVVGRFVITVRWSSGSFIGCGPGSRGGRDVEDAYLLTTIIEVHTAARSTTGVRRVHAELVLGRSHRIGRRKVVRLRCHGLAGVHRRKGRHQQRSVATWPDHVQRDFSTDAPDRLWVTDITQRRTSEGWVYCAAVLDVFSRQVVAWSIADHLRTELVVDALDVARIRRKPVGTILHSDRGPQGGFNWSSPHLVHGGVDGKANRLDEGVDGPFGNEVAWGAVA